MFQAYHSGRAAADYRPCFPCNISCRMLRIWSIRPTRGWFLTFGSVYPPYFPSFLRRSIRNSYSTVVLTVVKKDHYTPNLTRIRKKEIPQRQAQPSANMPAWPVEEKCGKKWKMENGRERERVHHAWTGQAFAPAPTPRRPVSLFLGSTWLGLRG